MIEVKDITFGYGKGTQVFSDFSLSVQPGSIYGLLGKNGEGKSTLLYLMMGLLRAGSGEIWINGERSFSRSSKMLADAFLLPEELSLPRTSLRAFVSKTAPFYPKFSYADMELYLSLFGLSADVHFARMSMGETKKAYMSFALATNTDILLMDEPTNGLDIPSKAQFRKVVMSGMSEGKTIIVSTHQVRDVDSLLDHVLMIDGGRLVLNSSIAHICRHLRFSEMPYAATAAAEVLYSQPSVGGNSVLMPRVGDQADTVINLEVLFNALLLNSAGVLSHLPEEGRAMRMQDEV